MTTQTSRQKLSKAPLTLALCQVRFSALRNMASYIPQVQEAMRKAGYRLDMSGKVQEILLGPQGPQVQFFDRWEFLNVEKTRSVVITEQFAAFQTTAYTVFEDFVPEVQRLMDALTASGADLVITRLGLRYVDAIIPSAGKAWRDYLDPSLHGTKCPVLNDTMMAHHVFGTTVHGKMLARITQNREGLTVPVEMVQQNLISLRASPEAGAVVTLIDIDHFIEWSKDFIVYQPEQLRQLAWNLKEDIYTVFRSFVTTAAIEEWK